MHSFVSLGHILSGLPTERLYQSREALKECTRVVNINL